MRRRQKLLNEKILPDNRSINRYWNAILRTWRQSSPHHTFGQAPENKAAVDKAIQGEIDKYRAENPGADAEELHRRRLMFCNAARKTLYDGLDDKSKARWIAEAQRVTPVDDEELCVYCGLCCASSSTDRLPIIGK